MSFMYARKENMDSLFIPVVEELKYSMQSYLLLHKGTVLIFNFLNRF